MIQFKACKLSYSTDSEVVGTSPQLLLERPVEATDSFPYHNLHHLPPISPTPVLNHYELNYRAKITDIVSGEKLPRRAGLFVNSKVRSLFEQFNIGVHGWYPVPVLEESETFEYYFLHLSPEPDEHIDYKNSLIIDQIRNDEILPVKSHQDILQEIKYRFFPVFKHIRLKVPVDLFRLPVDTAIYISPRLKDALENALVTGMEITDGAVGLEVTHP